MTYEIKLTDPSPLEIIKGQDNEIERLTVENAKLQQELALERIDHRHLNDLMETLLDQKAKLRTALEWYANNDNYDHWGAGGCDFGSDIENDRGQRARAALNEEK